MPWILFCIISNQKHQLDEALKLIIYVRVPLKLLLSYMLRASEEVIQNSCSQII